MIDAVWKFTAELSDLIKRKQNSIWAFIVRNSYRPVMLRDRFNRGYLTATLPTPTIRPKSKNVLSKIMQSLATVIAITSWPVYTRFAALINKDHSSVLAPSLRLAR
jgi:hypothetical protein